VGAGGKAGAHPKGTCDKCDGGHMTDDCPFYKKKKDVCAHPLSSECGTCETVKARFWPWLSGKNVETLKGVEVLLGSGDCKARSKTSYPDTGQIPNPHPSPLTPED